MTAFREQKHAEEGKARGGVPRSSPTHVPTGEGPCVCLLVRHLSLVFPIAHDCLQRAISYEEEYLGVSPAQAHGRARAEEGL